MIRVSVALLLLAAGLCAQDGFVKIFDGKTLDGWEGDPTYWRVEDGNLAGEVTPQTLLKRNSFITWRGGEVEDFELRLEYRITNSGNSGINYRSIDVPDTPFALRGYQLDIHGGDSYTGNNYEERGRAFLALRGQKTLIEPGAPPTLVEQFATAEDLQAIVRKEDWNQARIVARGDRIEHYVNTRLMNEVVDRDHGAALSRGLLGVQVHVGPPMRVEYRNIRLRHFDSGGKRKLQPTFEQLPARTGNPQALENLESQRKALAGR